MPLSKTASTHFTEAKKSVSPGRSHNSTDSGVRTISLESCIGDSVHVPGGGVGEIHSVFGSTFDGIRGEFVRVKLAGGRVAIFQIHI